MKKVAIGGGQGFWGDSPDAAIHMIRNADIQSQTSRFCALCIFFFFLFSRFNKVAFLFLQTSFFS